MSSKNSDQPDLVVASSSSISSVTSPSTPSSITPFMQVDHDTLRSLSSRVGYTPPPKSESVSVDQVEKAANKLFGPLGETWAKLTDTQKIKFGFLHLKCQPQIVAEKATNVSAKDHHLFVAKAIYNALDEGHPFGRRLNLFVRKGGDATPLEGEVCPDYLDNFYRKHGQSVWREYDQAPTIFNNPMAPNLKAASSAMIRFQEDDSSVCFMVVIANAIFYNMRNQNAESHDQAVANYCMNINRYMRNNFEDKEVFDYVFQMTGGKVQQKLLGLLEKYNPNKSEDQLVKHLDIEDETVKSLYEKVRERIRCYGALIVEFFKPFRAFAEDGDQIEFGGDWNTHMSRELPPSFCQLVQSTCPMYHAFLIVGVRLTESENVMGGLAFMIQDSNKRRPFAVVGLDLLLSMDTTRFLYVRNGLSFWTGEEDHPCSPGSTATSGGGDSKDSSSDQAFSPNLKAGQDDFERNPGYYFHQNLDPEKQHVFYS